MAEKQTEKQTYKVIKRKCRVMIDVPIRITEITLESVASHFTPDETEEEGLSWEWAERQNRLLHMLLNDEELLKEFLLGAAGNDLGLLLNNDGAGGLPEEEESQLFKQLFSRMENADAHFFEKAQRDGILGENIDLFQRAFVTHWKEARLSGLMVIE